MMQIGTPAPPPFAPQGRELLPPGVHDHEKSDASVRLIFYVVLAMIVGAVTTHFVLYLYLRGLAYIEPYGLQQPLPPADLRALPPPEPRLQIDEVADLARLREQENAHIAQYGWVDKDRGVVRIPVARAMEMAAEHGFPKWGNENPQRPGDVRAGAEGDLELKKSNVK